jgi:hypothetical protein
MVCDVDMYVYLIIQEAGITFYSLYHEKENAKERGDVLFQNSQCRPSTVNYG